MTLVLPPGTRLGEPGEVIAHGTADPPLPRAALLAPRACSWDELSAVIEFASSGGHHIAGTPDTYSHGWKLREGLPGKKELYSQLPTADKMSKTALKQHMDLHHNGGPDVGGRRSGPRNPSREHLLAMHEAMHADEPLSVNPPGSADNSALNGALSRTSRAHTHGNVTGMANRRPGIELSAKTAALEVTPAPYGKPGGPGLYGVKGLMHGPYFEQVVKALRGRGMDKGRASAVAYGALRKWAAGGGNVHPEVQAAAVTALAGEKAIGAAAKAVHGHAVSWDEVADRVTELAASPAQPRVPAGQAGGGQFGSGGQAQQQQAGAKSIASQTASKNVKAKIAANQQAKNKLLTQAAGYRAQADKLIAQRKVLQAELASASGATSSGQSGSTTSAGSSTTSSGSSTTASTAPATTSTAASTTPASTASTTASTSTALTSAQTAQINAQIGQLTTQIVAYQKQYAQAMAQAAKL